MLANGGSWKHVSKKKKFREEFATEEEAFNDFFRLGISFRATKTDPSKLNIKLYEQFYASDIIVASPLAIRMITSEKNDEKGNSLK